MLAFQVGQLVQGVEAIVGNTRGSSKLAGILYEFLEEYLTKP